VIGDSPLWHYRPDELYDLMAVNFPRRNESSFAWKSACSQFQALTGLRGFWPTSSSDENGDCYDISGQGRTLTYHGNARYNTYGLAPGIYLDGVGAYLSRADEAGLDITGNEGPIAAAMRGLTMGGWYRFSNAAAATEYMLSKWDVVGNQRSYALLRNWAGAISFGLSSTGADAATSVTTGKPAAGEWFFAAGRFDNSGNEQKTWYNAETATAANNNLIHAGTADFNMGAKHNGSDSMTGRLSLQFLCAAALSDSVIFSIFEQSRSLFGV